MELDPFEIIERLTRLEEATKHNTAAIEDLKTVLIGEPGEPGEIGKIHKRLKQLEAALIFGAAGLLGGKGLGYLQKIFLP